MQHLVIPSVLAHPDSTGSGMLTTSPGPMDVFGSSAYPEGSSPSRRQRISMACQYCRHRKIRCCGGAPCRNCTRSQRECEYAPVPEEINRATREKKAQAKATKSSTPSKLASGGLYPPTTLSPYTADTPVFDVPYVAFGRRPNLGHRRSVSVPNFEAPPWVMPTAPALRSPPIFENGAWMYNGWSSAPAIPEEAHTTTTPLAPAFPSVLEQTPAHDAYLQSQPQHYGPSVPVSVQSSYYPSPLITPGGSGSSSVNTDYISHPPVPQSNFPTSWSTPNLNLALTHPTPSPSHSPYSSPYLRSQPAKTGTPLHKMKPYHHSSPHTPYYSPYPTPPLFQYPTPGGTTQSTSPTLAPEMSMRGSSKNLVGLGIGMHDGSGSGSGDGMVGMGFGMGMGMGMMTEEVYHTPSLSPEEYMVQQPQF